MKNTSNKSAPYDKHKALANTINQYLTGINRLDKKINSFTTVLTERAHAQVKRWESKTPQEFNNNPLAGIPFAVKNLFDIKDQTTLAGSLINQDNPCAQQDSPLIQRLEKAGAILLGSLHMGEYAYDFTGENSHYGNCCNPHDLSRMSGGSSSGSGSATAAGLVDFTLGSDTNGSIRVPSSFCGIFGLKPTYGRLPRTGTFPFSDSLDHLGVMARDVTTLSKVFDCIQGYDAGDHACQEIPPLQTLKELNKGINELKIVTLGGYFEAKEFPQAKNAVQKIRRALGAKETFIPEGVSEGRSAAYIITNVEGSALHLPRLQTRPQDFDPDTRDRFLAGAMIPAQWYTRAQEVRKWFKEKMLSVFETYDVLIAPATPCTAPLQGQKSIVIGGEEQLLRPNLGYFTQPFSAIGLPSIVVPTQDEDTGLPIGVQIVAAPWREDICLRVAAQLEQNGFKFIQPELFFAPDVL